MMNSNAIFYHSFITIERLKVWRDPIKLKFNYVGENEWQSVQFIAQITSTIIGKLTGNQYSISLVAFTYMFLLKHISFYLSLGNDLHKKFHLIYL